MQERKRIKIIGLKALLTAMALFLLPVAVLAESPSFLGLGMGGPNLGIRSEGIAYNQATHGLSDNFHGFSPSFNYLGETNLAHGGYLTMDLDRFDHQILKSTQPAPYQNAPSKIRLQSGLHFYEVTYGYGLSYSFHRRAKSIRLYLGAGVGLTHISGSSYLTHGENLSTDCVNSVVGAQKNDKLAGCDKVQFQTSLQVGYGARFGLFIPIWEDSSKSGLHLFVYGKTAQTWVMDGFEINRPAALVVGIGYGQTQR